MSSLNLNPFCSCFANLFGLELDVPFPLLFLLPLSCLQVRWWGLVHWREALSLSCWCATLTLQLRYACLSDLSAFQIRWQSSFWKRRHCSSAHLLFWGHFYKNVPSVSVLRVQKLKGRSLAKLTIYQKKCLLINLVPLVLVKKRQQIKFVALRHASRLWKHFLHTVVHPVLDLLYRSRFLPAGAFQLNGNNSGSK